MLSMVVALLRTLKILIISISHLDLDEVDEFKPLCMPKATRSLLKGGLLSVAYGATCSVKNCTHSPLAQDCLYKDTRACASVA
jgi:hypothetical protein